MTGPYCWCWALHPLSVRGLLSIIPPEYFSDQSHSANVNGNIWVSQTSFDPRLRTAMLSTYSRITFVECDRFGKKKFWMTIRSPQTAWLLRDRKVRWFHVSHLEQIVIQRDDKCRSCVCQGLQNLFIVWIILWACIIWCRTARFCQDCVYMQACLGLCCSPML